MFYETGLEGENERLNGELGLVNTKLKRLEIELSLMRANECKQSEVIGELRAEIGVEKSRCDAAKSEILDLRTQLEQKQADIALTQTAIQVYDALFIDYCLIIEENKTRF